MIDKLLIKNPGSRLGAKGLQEIKKEKFFSGISFTNLINKKHKAPCKPEINKDNMTNNFDEEYLNMELSESPISDWIKENHYSKLFEPLMI